MNISNKINNNTGNNIKEKGGKSSKNINKNKKNIQELENNYKEMSIIKNIIQPEGNSTENSDRNFELAPSSSSSKSFDNVPDDSKPINNDNDDKNQANSSNVKYISIYTNIISFFKL